MSKIEYKLYSDGCINKVKYYGWFKSVIRFILNKDDCESTLYVPKKAYNTKEEIKLLNLLRKNNCLDNKDMAVLVNAVRPNTFKESIEEVETNKYYFDAAAKEDIHLLESGKQI